MKRIDDLQAHGLRLVQDTDLFCFGCDAVELANFAGGNAGTRVCDLGAGNGIVGVLLAGKFGKTVTAVELQEPCVRLIEENIALNGLQGKLRAVHASLQDYAARSDREAFDAVVCNPPYRKAGSGQRQSASAVELARHELAVTLKEVTQAAARLLQTGGKFFLVQQCERLAETIQLCKAARLEPKVLQILTPNEQKPPHLFLLACKKDGKEGLQVLRERSVRAYGCD